MDRGWHPLAAAGNRPSGTEAGFFAPVAGRRPGDFQRQIVVLVTAGSVRSPALRLGRLADISLAPRDGLI